MRREHLTEHQTEIRPMSMVWIVTLVLLLLQNAATSDIARAQVITRATPPSRAGDVGPSSNYASEFTDILGQVVNSNGFVRYDLLSGPLDVQFRRVLKAVEEFDARALTSDEEKLAFWMNAYNVQMLQNVLENPTVTNIAAGDVPAEFFKTPRRVAGYGITIDQIEHVILRRQDGPRHLAGLRVMTLDPRIHVGINCAAVSCPPLRPRAFTASNMNEELDRAMREFTGSERHVRMEDGIMTISSLLDWYGADFDRTGRPAGDFLLEYMPEGRADYDEIRVRLEGKTAAELISDPNVRFEYDWSVNRASTGR